jgi:hypothetical protein
MATAAPSLDAQRPAPVRAAGYLRGSRDLRIDFLRGFAIFAMVVDHVGGSRSWLYAITGGDRFYVSAAEAFVFLAGIVAGMVYGPRAARHGYAAAAKLLRRAGVICLWSMGLTLIEPFAANALGLGWEDPLKRNSLLEYFVSVLTLHRTYHLTDVLLLYALLFSVAGLVIVWMVDGHTKAVLVTSWSLWAIWQTATDYPAPWDIQAMTVFQFAAWQALFVTGLAIGIHRDALVERCSERVVKAGLIVGGLGLAGSIVSYQLRGVNRGLGATAATHLLSKSDLGIGRLIVFTVVALFGFSVATLAWRWLNLALGWLLIPLGQNSLAAYILHVGVVMLIAKAGLLMFGNATTPEQNTVLEIAGVLATLGAVHGLGAGRAWLNAPFDATTWNVVDAEGLPSPVVSLRHVA